MFSLVFQPCSTPSNPKYALCADLCGQKAIFSLFCPLFGPHSATFGTFWVWQKAHTGLSGCFHWCSNLVPPLPTQNMPYELICVAKRLFLAYFGPHIATFGTFWVWQMAKTDPPVCPYWCSNLVPPLPIQNRPSGPICVAKRLFLAYFGPFWPQ